MKKSKWQSNALASLIVLTPLSFSTGFGFAQENDGDTPRKKRQERVVRETRDGDSESQLRPESDPERARARLRAQGGFGLGGPGGPGTPPGRGMPPGGMFGPAMLQRLPLMMALDTDRNGTLSSEEIESATAALRKLDKNGDGKLTIEELRPEIPNRQAPEVGTGNPLENFKRLLKARDANGDGKLSGDEIPPAMAGRLERIDLNGDGAIDADEIASMGGRLGARPESREGTNRREKREDGAGEKPKRSAKGEAAKDQD